MTLLQSLSSPALWAPSTPSSSSFSSPSSPASAWFEQPMNVQSPLPSCLICIPLSVTHPAIKQKAYHHYKLGHRCLYITCVQKCTQQSPSEPCQQNKRASLAIRYKYRSFVEVTQMQTEKITRLSVRKLISDYTHFDHLFVFHLFEPKVRIFCLSTVKTLCFW